MGLRELVLLALVVVVLYGRSGVLKSRQFQTIWPWISPRRRMTRRTGRCGRVRFAPGINRNSQSGRARPKEGQIFLLGATGCSGS